MKNYNVKKVNIIILSSRYINWDLNSIIWALLCLTIIANVNPPQMLPSV